MGAETPLLLIFPFAYRKTFLITYTDNTSMTQRTVHKAKLNGHGERERFEKWLLTPAKGRMPMDGGEYQQRTIRQNLERAAQAPFSIRTRLALMEGIFSTTDPAKALSILKGLAAITEHTGSVPAKEAYGRLADNWLMDSRISDNEPGVGTEGFAFIYMMAMEVPTDRNVAFPPRTSVSRSRNLGDGPYYVGYTSPRMCGYDGSVHADDVEDVFLG